MQASPPLRAHPDDLMLSYKEYDNAQAVEIVLWRRKSSTQAKKLEAFIKRHLRCACSK